MSELITRKLVNLRPEKFEILDIELPMIDQTATKIKPNKSTSTSKNADKNSKEERKTNSKLLQTGPKQKFSTFKYTDNSESEISEDLSQKFLQNNFEQINKLQAFNNMKINGSKNKTIVPIILLRNSNVVNSNLSATDWFFRQIEHFIRQRNNDCDDETDNDNHGQKLMTELLPICILIRNQKNNNNALSKYKQESLDDKDEEKTLLKIRPFVTAQIQPVGTVMDVLTGTVDVIAFHQDRSGFWYRDF